MENLSSIFFYHLDKAIKTYRQYAQARLKENGFEITIDQWMVLKAISDNADISQNELSELVFKDKASVARIVEMLVTNKYLIRDSHPESGRRRQLSITKKGNNLLTEIRPSVLKNRKQAMKNISAEDLKTAENVLKRIADNCKK
jgi:MarR family transcriptional regulator, transcriptional regulator for hemolysin